MTNRKEKIGIILVSIAFITMVIGFGSADDNSEFYFPALACWMSRYVELSTLQMARPISLLFTLIAVLTVIWSRLWRATIVLLTLFLGVFVLTSSFQRGFLDGFETKEEWLARQCPSNKLIIFQP